MYKPRKRPAVFPKWLLILFGFVFVVFAYDVFLFRSMNATEGEPLVNVSYSSVPTQSPGAQAVASDEPATSETSPAALPENAMIEVPFLSQAPHKKWDAYHEETCEEASLLMAVHYYKKTQIDSLDAGENELREITGYQDKVGYGVSITIEQLNETAKGVYGLSNGRVKHNATLDDIKREIAAGRPVIFPAAGRLLGNPNFRQPGPVYHMLVIKGYDKDGFITNDPGTSRGNDYRYSFDTIDKAFHDWNPDDITKGGRSYLVFD